MIHVDKLTRTYGDFTAVDQVSFTIGQGEIVGLLGHNGAGKTTIMKMMTGFLEPTAGKVTMDSLDVQSHLQEVQGRIGYLPENCPVYPEMTVIDYLDYAASLHAVPIHQRTERILESIARTELEAKAGQGISTLSRGYRQRVGVAQAILHHPKILILDEPTNGLDPTQIQHMRKLIKNLAARSTIIISTHILQEVQAVCDRVLIIRDGHLALDARLDELQACGRLVVGTDLGPAETEALFSRQDDIQSWEVIETNGEKTKYGLQLTNGANRDGIASDLAHRILKQDGKLFDLYQEQRNLEIIFGEITDRDQGGKNNE